MSPDPSSPATKEDLAAVRDDLTAVRSELLGRIDSLEAKLDSSVARLDGKVDSAVARLDGKIDSAVARLAKGIVEVNGKIDRLQESVPTRAEWDRLFRNLDHLRGRSDDNDKTVTVHGKILGEHKAALEDHAGRLGALERGS